MADIEEDLGGCLGVIAYYAMMAALAIGVLGFFLQSIFISIFVWGPAALLLLVFIRLFINNKLFKLRPGEESSRTLPIEFDEEKLRWSLAERRVDAFSGNMKPVWVATGLASILTISVLLGLYFSPEFLLPGHVWFLGTIEVSQTGTLVLYSILSQVILGGVIGLNYQGLQNSLTSRTESLVEGMNRKLEGTGKLRSLEDRIGSLYSELEVECPTDYRGEVQEAANENGVGGRRSPEKINSLVEENIREARLEVNNLEKAINLRNEVEEFYEKTAHEVRKTGSVPLIKELEDDYQGLDSAPTKKLLKRQAWEDYYEVLGLLKEELQDLTEVAKKYQQEGFEEYKEEKEEEEEEKESTGSLEGEMTEELAYQVLGLQKQASVEEIKKKKNKLAQAYHPDHNKEVSDGTMMKKVNIAYDFLKEKRGFR